MARKQFISEIAHRGHMRTHKKKEAKMPEYQKCPICNGTGTIQISEPQAELRCCTTTNGASGYLNKPGEKK